MNDKLARYARLFGKLRTDVGHSRWSPLTRNRAPHKPLLLLSVLDLFEQDSTRPNLLELTPDLGELFTRYWPRVMSPDRRGNIALPFFHLRSDGFWHLLPKPGKENVVASAAQIRSLFRLRDTVTGARLDDELYEILHAPEARATLRGVLIETYFSPELQPVLVKQSATNHEAFRYSEELLQPDYGKVAEVLTEQETYRPAARDQGFRRAITTAYAHRCALCGIRVLTLDGHTAVEASHIIPWSLSRDDRPANGMALCRLCHWAFDEGLLRVNANYGIATSSQLTAIDNLPGYLTNLEGRGIVGPAETAFWPDLGALRWHHDNVFRAW
ncbi:MAG: HNH endonuclease family protein [uncultured Rubrobacteraceae bacterium]|uniref:HNH endonuclease family protein n=1 Tax=uncultured Rubrobacteraceae bacterium TaxID=349277 RepID=A0A6J4P7T8_9ACTN|nr:MAG: HNH endonuclease family protein [uncultured Rubrobacteraceae bacterium]